MSADDVSLFVFGTLRDAVLRRAVIGRDVEAQPAVLKHARVALVPEGHLPLLVEAQDAEAEGLLLTGLGPKDVARLDYYEAIYHYWLDRVQVETVDGQQVATQTYRAPEGIYEVADQDWSLRDWQDDLGDVIRAAALEIMRMQTRYTPPEVADRMGVIRTRAQARVNAQTRARPSDLRSGFTEDDVEVIKQDIVYSNFFAFEEISLKHPRFAGGMSDVIDRGVLMAADAVTVLPYDPKRDRVLLIEQFRTPMFLRGDPKPWALEAIAGRLDPGETPERTARREAFEEAGVEIGALHVVGEYYSNTGSNSEYVYSFVAECDLPDDIAGVGGLQTEHEDIRSLILPYAALEEAIRTGEINTGPLLTAALWLRVERDRLRAEITPSNG